MSETTAQGTSEAGTKEPGFGERLLAVLVRVREVSVLIVALGLVFYFQAANPAFLSESNILSLARFAVPYVVIASALCLLLICGELDLSVGQSFAFAPIVMYLAYDKLFLVLPLAVVAGLLAVALVGLVNGVITVYLGVSSLITTLGMFFLLAGLNVILTGGFPATTPDTNTLTKVLGEYPWAGTIWALVIVAVLQLVLSRTRWGLHTYATGGNPLGSREAGVRVARIKIGNFIMCAALGGFVGIIESFRINSIDPLAGGPDIVLLCIASAVIGGTALLGGIGTVTGAFLGALVLVILRNGFTLQGIDSYTFNVVLGIAILAAMVLNVYIARLRGAGRV
ncbi:MAG: Ribose ABC transport system, permease protein RbsC [uncultured Rubrobacteraceae bacterium]|uniref:Ribose ABC transport system, permease protein RbsC n=1 Tax=uncultured Rubrobacteraceae bacterium TaxID=349277 RepID=A0A6J4RPP8_9ACTN|nr:MAG: Ribose ABC transport system, permease protein RbsC [uncultured Rubrobacteraceae bacterium]